MRHSWLAQILLCDHAADNRTQYVAFRAITQDLINAIDIRRPLDSAGRHIMELCTPYCECDKWSRVSEDTLYLDRWGMKRS